MKFFWRAETHLLPLRVCILRAPAPQKFKVKAIGGIAQRRERFISLFYEPFWR